MSATERRVIKVSSLQPLPRNVQGSIAYLERTGDHPSEVSCWQLRRQSPMRNPDKILLTDFS
jgi:hypothetical protein